MKKNVQKLLSIVLTVIMMISMLPFSVFAADLDVYDVEEPAVEAVSVPAEEQEIESTVEDVLVGNAETEDELLVEDAEIVEDSSEEIETVDAADPAEADADVVIEESETDETLGALNDGYVDVGGKNFPDSFKYGSNTYAKSGNPVALDASYKIQGRGQTNWLNKYNLNGQQVNSGKIYYQVYTSGNRSIVVYEIPSLIEVMQGTGLYMSPKSLHNESVDVGRASFENTATAYRVKETGGAAVSSGVITYLENGNVTYGFTTLLQSSTQNGTIDVIYYVRSGSDAYIRPTYTITYKDGVDDEVVFEDQIYENEDAVEGHNTPHFKWNGAPGDPVRPGYRFMGWKDQEGTEYANSDAVANKTIEGNATYTAQWVPNSITVSKEVALGSGVEMKDIDQTIYYALWDPKAEDWFKKDGQIVYKTITITDGVPSGNAVFDENDLLESLDYSVSELKVASGTAVTELSVNDEFEVDGKTIKVSGIKGQELDASGAVITDNENNTHLDTTNAAYVKFINTYTSDQTDSFELNKKWYDYQNGQRVDVTDTIQDVTATITLYRTIDGNTYEEVESKTLNGTEPTPWKAEFTNLKHTDDNGNVYTYAARETACTAGYKAYSTSSSEKPMPATEYKSSHQNIFNIQDAYGIYHSSNGTIEWFAVGEKIKLVDEVEPGYLYGGYYKYTETGNHKGSALDTYAKTGLDEDFTATENNTIYYLKEVDDKYLVPLVFITYNTRKEYDPQYLLRGLWVLMNLDPDYSDYNNKFGFIIDDGEIQPDFTCEELEVNHKDTGSTHHTLNSLYTDKFEEGARLVVSDQASKLTKNNEFTLRAYFVTPDGVRVTGIKERIIHTGNLTFANKSWNKDGGGIWQDTPKPYPGSETVLATSKLGASTTIPGGSTYQIKSAADILTYTVTKIDDGKKVSQEVQVGDNVGKITYAGKKGYAFAGWYLDKAYTKVADFSAVTGDMTVYAKYVKASAIDLSFAKKSSKSGSVTLKATLKVTGAPDLTDATVSCDYKGQSSAVKFTGVKTTKSGKTTVSTYTGTVDISGLANKGSFTASISYKTPDGTIASLADKTCKYTSGKVTVK